MYKNTLYYHDYIEMCKGGGVNSESNFIVSLMGKINSIQMYITIVIIVNSRKIFAAMDLIIR